MFQYYFKDTQFVGENYLLLLNFADLYTGLKMSIDRTASIVTTEK